MLFKRKTAETPTVAPAAVPFAAGAVVEGIERWYNPVAITGRMIGERSVRPETISSVLALYQRLSPDDYVTALIEYYREGLRRFGAEWRYADLVTAVYAAGKLLQPERYLEIGVRRGRSLVALAEVAPQCRLLGFDYWKPNYAGMENPGPDFVERELRGLGFQNELELVSGNSHETVPAYFTQNPDAWFDLITVDGDHTPQGARDDLETVLQRLKIGGVLLFDDISHPTHPELLGVWKSVTSDPQRFSTWEYTDLGYGIGIAVRIR